MIIASLMNMAGPDMFVVLLIVLVLFGAKRLPGLARGMGQALSEFQKAKNEFTQELHSTAVPPKRESAENPLASMQLEDVPVAPAPLGATVTTKSTV